MEMRTMRRVLAARATPAVAVGVTSLAIAGGGYALAAGGGTIHACAKKSGGALRLAGRCRRGERAVAWSIAGPPGRQGVQGKQGAQGATGATGPQGVAGTPATKLFATVALSGTTATIDASSPGVRLFRFSAGVYEVNFGQDISHCAALANNGAVPVFSATAASTGRSPGYALADLSSAGGTDAGSGFPSGDTVTVETFSAATDASVDTSFGVAVFC